MFEAISSGKNKNYGVKGKHINLTDNRVLNAIKNGWINTKNLKYIGTTATYGHIKHTPVTPEELMPVRKINLLKTLEQQNKVIIEMNEKLEHFSQINNKLLRLIKKKLK